MESNKEVKHSKYIEAINWAVNKWSWKCFHEIIYRSKLLTSPFFVTAISKVCNFGLKGKVSQIFDSKC